MLGKSIGQTASADAPRLYGLLKGRYFWVICIGLVALILRLVHLQDIASSPLFNAPMAESRTYVETAVDLAAGHWADPPESFQQPPLYSYYLAFVFHIAERSYFLPRLIQVFLGAINCVLIYHLGRIAFPESVARGAGFAAAAYGPLIYFGCELLPTSIAIFLLLIFLLCVLRPPCPSPWNWLGVGFLLGLVVLTMVHMLVCLPLFLLWLFYTRADLPEGCSRKGRVLFVLLGCGLVIAPVLVFSNVDFNFYLDHTLPYLNHLLHSLYLFWHGPESGHLLDPYYAPRNDSTVLGILMWKYGLAFPFGLVAPLALVGMACYWRNQPRASAGRVLLLFLLAYMALVVVFFTTAQHRLAAVPLILLFACSGLQQILVRRSRDKLRLLIPAAVLVVASNVGAGVMDKEGSGIQHYIMGMAYQEQGLQANAMQAYRTTLKRLPNHHKSVERLAQLHLERQEYGRAIGVYETFLRDQPEAASIRFLLAEAQLEAGHLRRALAGYESLVLLHPQWAALHGRLGHTYLEIGQPLMAISAYQHTLALQPDSTQARYQLARLYMTQDSVQVATEQFRLLVKKNPANATFHNHIADLLIRQEGPKNTFVLPRTKATDTAETHLQEAIRLAPNRPKPHWSLGTMLARQARYSEAIKYFERLTRLEPGNSELLVWLANLSQRTGQNEKARKYLSRYAEIEGERRRQNLVQQEMDDLLKKMVKEETIPTGDL